MLKIQVDKCFFLPEKGFNWRTYRSSFQTPTGYSIASSSTISCQRTVDCSTSVSETCVYPVQTDKASMFEEIIEYIKFLQLQVKVRSPPPPFLCSMLSGLPSSRLLICIVCLWLKVLSMSRLGTTEAVVPLLTESQTEVNHITRAWMNSEYIVRASCDWAAAGNAELRWPSPVPEVRLRLRQAASRRRQPIVVYFWHKCWLFVYYLNETLLVMHRQYCMEYIYFNILLLLF